MQEFLGFALTVVIISISGVMSPGPLFTANIMHGLKEGTQSGLKIAAGHTVIELPLIILLAVGVISLETIPEFKTTIVLLGAIGLFGFAGLQIKNTLTKKMQTGIQVKHGAFLTGVLFSALNPFFIIWWLTIGFKLISDSIEIWSYWGIGILFGVHIWMDFVWLGFVAFSASKAGNILSNQNYRILMIVLSGVLIYFGISFVLEI